MDAQTAANWLGEDNTLTKVLRERDALRARVAELEAENESLQGKVRADTTLHPMADARVRRLVEAVNAQREALHAYQMTAPDSGGPGGQKAQRRRAWEDAQSQLVFAALAVLDCPHPADHPDMTGRITAETQTRSTTHG